MVPGWTDDYVGLPYKMYGRDRSGLDCWGLCALVWREQFELHLPLYEEVIGASISQMSQKVADGIWGSEAGAWERISPASAQGGDGILLRIAGLPIHTAVIVDPPWFLHIFRGVNACLETYDSARWRRRVLGIYRHRSRMRAGHGRS